MNLRSFALFALTIVPLACRSAAPAPASIATPAGFDAIHAPWSEILARHVRGGNVDYAALKEARAPLDAYVLALEGVTRERYDALSRDERQAFWINAYNACVLRRIVDAYPVASVRDIGDGKRPIADEDLVALGALRAKLGKSSLSPNDVENRILRAEFEDARVHAALHDATRGGAPLRAEAYTGERLDAQLDDQARRWLADPTRNRIDAAARRAELSRTFEWFAEDFAREAGSAPAWVARFRPDDASWLTRAPALAYLDHDWSLDAAP